MNTRGFALVTVVLLMVGLAVLATALAYSAAQQATVNRSLRDLVRARHAAEGAVEHAIAQWSAAPRSLDPIGEPVPLLAGVVLEPEVRVDAVARRLSADSWLIVGTASVGPAHVAPIVHRATRRVRSVDADSVGVALDAAVIADAVRLEAGALVSAASPAAGVDGEAAALCERWPGAGAALRVPADSVAVSADALVDGDPVLAADTQAARFRAGIGFLDRADLAVLAIPASDSLVAPAPAAGGAACDTALADNWGATDGPCARRHVLVHAAGPLRVSEGYGQGVLLIDGDLVLDGGARFRGVVLATGSVTIRDGSVEGVVLASRVRIETGGAVRLDRCAVAAALAYSPPLRAAHLPARSWLPTFD